MEKNTNRPYPVIDTQMHTIGRIRVFKDTILLKGQQHPFTYVDFSNSVCVIPMYEGKMVLIKQYRHAINEWMYEFPAGSIDNDEAPCEAAKRELQEETGYVCDQLTHLGEFFTNQGLASCKCDLYFANCTQYVCSKMEETELIEVQLISVEDFEQMIKTNTFKFLLGITGWHHIKMRNLR